MVGRRKTKKEKHMRKILTQRFAILKKGGQYLKPVVDDTPYLLFKTEAEAKACMVFDKFSEYKIIKVQVTIQPARA